MNKLSNLAVFAPLRRLSIRWWLLLGAFLLLWRLDYSPFWNPDEGRYAAAALEMAQGFDGAASDWVVPHLNSIPRLNKPPLVYWTAASFIKLFGATEFACRLVPALAALGIMLLLYFLGRRMFDETTGVCAALVWATAGFTFALARVLNTDMLLAATMALTYAGIWFAVESGYEGKRGPVTAYIVAGIGMGLGMLAKGPVSVALPLLSGFIYLTAAKRWRRVSSAGVLLAVVVAIAIAAPWFLAMDRQRPGFTLKFIVGENFDRLTGKGEFHKPIGPWFYPALMLAQLLPWTAFLVIAFRRGGGPAELTNAWRGRFYLALWAGLIIAFFSVSKTKLVTYTLPAFPALALLLGEVLGYLIRNKEKVTSSRTAVLAITVLFNVLLFVAPTYYLLSNKSMERADAGPFILGFALASILGCASALTFWKVDVWKWFCGQVLGSSALLLTLIGVAGHIALYEDASPMIKAIMPYMRKDDVFIQYRTFQAGAIFYADRPNYIADFENNSGFEESHPNYKKIFATPQQITNLLKTSPRWFLLARSAHPEAFTKFGAIHLLGRNNDYVLISNQPPPGRFQYDFVAPAERARQAKKRSVR